MALLTPHVVEGLNKFIDDENAYAVIIHYDDDSRLLFVESLDERGTAISTFQRVNLASWVVEPCEAFVDWVVHVPEAGSVYYSPHKAEGYGG